MCSLAFALLACCLIPSEAYPTYKFGLYQGQADSVDACGPGGSRNKCFVWDVGMYPTCYQFSTTESYSGAQYNATSLTYDLHPGCTDCSCSSGAGRKGTTLGSCTFFPFGGVYWLKLECVLESAADSCPSDYVECTDCVTGCTSEASTSLSETSTSLAGTATTTQGTTPAGGGSQTSATATTTQGATSAGGGSQTSGARSMFGVCVWLLFLVLPMVRL